VINYFYNNPNNIFLIQEDSQSITNNISQKNVANDEGKENQKLQNIGDLASTDNSSELFQDLIKSGLNDGNSSNFVDKLSLANDFIEGTDNQTVSTPSANPLSPLATSTPQVTQPASSSQQSSPISITQFKPDDKSSFTQGDTINFSAIAQDKNNDKLLYQFLINGQVIRSWDTNNNFSWSLNVDAPLKHVITVEVKNSKEEKDSKSHDIFVYLKPIELNK